MDNSMHIVIATAGRADLLRRTLRSLTECHRPASYGGLLVVENGGRRGAEEVVGEFAASLRARYVFQSAAGKSLALNAALKHVGEGLVFFADDDVRFAPETLEAYARAAEGCTGGVFFGGPTEAEYEQRPAPWMMDYLPISARGWEWTGRSELVDKPAFLGFNWAAFATDLRAAGGFNPQMGPGADGGSTVGDETHIQRRMLERGMVGRYVPEARVWHYIPRERCSPQWMLDRNYRQGLARGMQMPLGAAALGGVPLWLMRRYAWGVLRNMTAVAAGARFRFEAAHRHQHNRGLLRGVRLQRQRRAEKAGGARWAMG